MIYIKDNFSDPLLVFPCGIVVAKHKTAIATWLPLAAWLTLTLTLSKAKNTTVRITVFMNKYAGFVTYQSGKKNAGFATP